MEVVSRSPFAVASPRVRRANGRDSRAIVVKATFALRTGEWYLADEQAPIRTRASHQRGDPNASLQYPPDTAPWKARPEVLVVGSAFSSSGPTRSLVVRLAVAEVDKTLEVFCDRIVSQHGGMREGAPFVRMPLVAERAAYDEATNPIGVRPDRVDSLGRVTLPNLQPTGLFVQDLTTRIQAIGLGPIPPTWPVRGKLWTAGGALGLERVEREPIVDSLDKSFFNDAPRDQQVQAISPTERIVLENLHPDTPRLVTCLPGIAPRAFLEGSEETIPLVLDTLVIDTDAQLCFATWRALLTEPNDKDRVVIVAQKNGVELPWSDADPLDEDTHDQPSVRAVHRLRADTLPFRRALAAGVDLGRAATPTRPSSPGDAAPNWFARASTAPTAGSSWSTPPSKPDPAVPSQPPPAHQQAVTAMQPPAIVAAPPAEQPSYAMQRAAMPAGISGQPIPPAYVPAVTPREAAPARVPSHAVVVGTEAASNAAAVENRPTESEEASQKRPKPAKSTDPVDLIWVDPASRKRLRAWFKSLLEDDAFEDFDSRHERPTSDPQADEAARDAMTVLTREGSIDAAGLDPAVEESIDDHGRFTPPVVVIEGELRMTFDERARLKALVGIVGPLSATDKRLKELCEAAEELLKAEAPSDALVSRQTLGIREHHASASSRGAAQALDGELDAAMVDARAYDTRVVLGGPRLRALLQSGGESVVVYLPEAVRTKLPLFDSFRARLIAEVVPKQDRRETHWLALSAMALARALPRRGKPG